MHHNTTNQDEEGIPPIFSIQDVLGMTNFFVEKETLGATDSEDISSILVSRVGLYALVVTDSDKVTSFFNSLFETGQDENGITVTRKALITDYFKKYLLDNVTRNCNGCTETQEVALFELFFLKYFNILDSGLNLYKAPVLSNGEYGRYK